MNKKHNKCLIFRLLRPNNFNPNECDTSLTTHTFITQVNKQVPITKVQRATKQIEWRCRYSEVPHFLAIWPIDIKFSSTSLRPFVRIRVYVRPLIYSTKVN